MRQQGQVILILILVMTVALAIGLSIVQKSLVDVSTSSKVEQSSRAFSAAEAGIEKALSSATSSSCTDCQIFNDNSSAVKKIEDSLVPAVPAGGRQQDALEYGPLLNREDVAQVWLADYTSDRNPPPVLYTQDRLDVYWGAYSETETDKPALEVTLVYTEVDRNNNNRISYKSQNYYLENSSASRNTPGFSAANGVIMADCPLAGKPVGGKIYQCKETLDFPVFTPGQPRGLMLVRARLLFNTKKHPFAVQAVGSCGINCSLPPQARIIESTGKSGETQRKVKVTESYENVLPYYNYAIFSAGDITKE